MAAFGSAQPFRVPAASPGQRIDWPAAFGTRFTVFADVEEEFDWRAPLRRENRSTTAIAALPEAHRRFADRGVGLACMIDHPVATDPAAVAILGRMVEDGRSEIGTQLHPWVNPPFADGETPADSYAGNLPPWLEAAKLDELTGVVAAAFGRSPRAYRAGRYGIGQATLGLLASRGYRLDCSMRAGYDYTADGGPDFRAVDSHPYRIGGLVELPSTTVFTGLARSGGARLHAALGRVPQARGLFARTRLLQRVSLTPEDMPLGAALTAVDHALRDGVCLLSFSFHSPSLVPGHTPYVRDAADLRAFHRWWQVMLDRLEERGVRYASLADILAAVPDGLP